MFPSIASERVVGLRRVGVSIRAGLVGIGLLFLSACGSSGQISEIGGLEPSDPPPVWFVDQEVLPDDLATVLVADLAEQLGAGSDVVTQGSALVTWIRSGLGCPLEAEQVSPDSVDGYLVYFTSGADWYRAHVATNGRYRFCDDPGELEAVLIPVLEE